MHQGQHGVCGGLTSVQEMLFSAAFQFSMNSVLQIKALATAVRWYYFVVRLVNPGIRSLSQTINDKLH